MSAVPVDMADRIQRSLAAALAPIHVQLVDESYQHAAGPDARTHWNLVVVSAAFSGQRPVQRHRLVHQALAGELAAGIHALTMKTLTPEEWGGEAVENPAPPCLGGGKASPGSAAG